MTRGSFVASLFALLVVAVSFVDAQTWAPQVANVQSHFSHVSSVDGSTGYVSGAYGVICKTTNAGATWNQLPSGTTTNLSAQQFLNASMGWVAGQNGTILKTTDGGSSWASQASGTTSWLNCIYFETANIGWAAGTGGVIIATTNGGASWASQVSGTSATIEGGCFTSTTNGILSCSDGKILKTTNSGASWSAQTLNGSLSLNCVDFITSQAGWVVGSGGYIAKTNDGGATWTSQSSGTSQNLNGVAFANADTGWAVGDGGTVRWTTNGGTSWQAQFSTTAENLRHVFVVNTRHGYAVGLNNTIIEYATEHALPIQLASFTATVVQMNTVRLDWRTISEVNNYGFEMQRSLGTPDVFATLAGSFVAGHGTTSGPQDYTWTHQSVPAGRVYYRLRQVDLDGTVHYSEPISVDVLTDVREGGQPTVFNLNQNYPNPFNPTTRIEFSVAKPALVTLRVFNLLGQEVATLVNEELNAGNYSTTFSGHELSSGVYLYKLDAGGFTSAKKLIVSK